MSDLIAYELRSEYAGSTTLDGRSVPVFTGGLVAAGDRDLNLREELDTAPAKGYVVLYDFDVSAVGALEEHPAFKRTAAPKGAKPRNPFAHRTADDLRRELSALGLATGGSKEDLSDRLLGSLTGEEKVEQPPQPEGPPSAEVSAGDQHIDTEARK